MTPSPNRTRRAQALEVWFAIPSASPDRARANLPVWRDMGYRIAVLQNQERADIPADITIWADRYPGWPASVNHLARNVVPTNAPIIVTGGDDMLPDPNHSAQQIARQFLDHFPDTFGVMQPTADTYMNASEYCGSPWLGRDWINKAYNAKGPLPPYYHHNWADHDLFHVATARNALWLRPDLTHHHQHFSRTNTPPPDYWLNNVAAHDEADARRFIARRWLNFPDQPIPAPADLPALAAAERYWLTRHAPKSILNPQANRLTTILNRCNRVALYALGTELRAAAAALESPNATITAIIDDNPNLNSTRFYNYPVIPIERLDPTSIDDIIITARAVEPTIRQRCAHLEPLGITIHSLHHQLTPA